MHPNRPKKDSKDYKKNIEDPIKKIIKDNPGLFNKVEKHMKVDPLTTREPDVVGNLRQKHREKAEAERARFLAENQKLKAETPTTASSTPIQSDTEKFTNKGVKGIASKGKVIRK